MPMVRQPGKLRRVLELAVALSALTGCKAVDGAQVALEGADDSGTAPSTTATLPGRAADAATELFNEGGSVFRDAASMSAKPRDAGGRHTDSTATVEASIMVDASHTRDASIGVPSPIPFDAAYQVNPDAGEVEAASTSGAGNGLDGAADAPSIDVLSACQDDGVSEVNADGVCAVNWVSGAGVGIISKLTEMGACGELFGADGLQVQLRVEEVELSPDPVIPGNVVALYPSTVVDRDPQCSVLMEWNSLAAVPSLVPGQLVGYTQRQILQSDGVTAGFIQLLDEAGDVLFAQYSGPSTLHVQWGVPGVAMTWLPEICRAPFSAAADPVMLHAVRLEAGEDACRLDAGSWTCCQLWQQPYRVYLQAVSVQGLEELAYTLSRGDFFVAIP